MEELSTWSISSTSAIVTERLNILLDQKYEIQKKQNLIFLKIIKKIEIIIHQNFRLVYTTDLNKINQMSPVFINRFDVR